MQGTYCTLYKTTVAILGLGGSFVAFVASIATGISADIKSLETTLSADNKSFRTEMTANMKSLETKIDSLRDILLNHEGRIATNSVKVDLFKPRID